MEDKAYNKHTSVGSREREALRKAAAQSSSPQGQDYAKLKAEIAALRTEVHSLRGAGGIKIDFPLVTYTPIVAGAGGVGSGPFRCVVAYYDDTTDPLHPAMVARIATLSGTLGDPFTAS